MSVAAKFLDNFEMACPDPVSGSLLPHASEAQSYLKHGAQVLCILARVSAASWSCRGSMQTCPAPASVPFWRGYQL